MTEPPKTPFRTREDNIFDPYDILDKNKENCIYKYI